MAAELGCSAAPAADYELGTASVDEEEAPNHVKTKLGTEISRLAEEGGLGMTYRR